MKGRSQKTEVFAGLHLHTHACDAALICYLCRQPDFFLFMFCRWISAIVGKDVVFADRIAFGHARVCCRVDLLTVPSA